MNSRTATCQCGQLRANCKGEPVRVSVCHCLDCQKRSGSAFAAQARWPDTHVTLTGEINTWVRTAESGHRATHRFCPYCGSTVAYEIEGWPNVIAVPLGAFADPKFPAPKFSVYEHRKRDWVTVLGTDVEHSSSPSSAWPPGAVRRRQRCPVHLSHGPSDEAVAGTDTVTDQIGDRELNPLAGLSLDLILATPIGATASPMTVQHSQAQ
jgi:hypothetical protein